MKYFRSFLFLTAFLSLTLHGQAQKASAAKASIKRTYYDYQGRQLHEEYQYIRTANQLVVKQGYYKSYTENGVIKARANYRNDELDGTVTTYENWGNGPKPFEVDHYKAGKRHGYSALYWFNDEGKRLLEHEGSYYHGQYDGRWVQYEHNGAKLVENWRRGVRHGETIQYDAIGQKTREGYFDEGQPFSGTLDKQFGNGNPSASTAYQNCFREGPSQTWYPNGKLKTWAQYHRGAQVGPTRHYLESDGPDEFTKAALAQVKIKKVAERTENTKQAQEAMLTIHQKEVRQLQEDSIWRSNTQVAAAKRVEELQREAAETILATAQAKQASLARVEGIAILANSPDTTATRRKPYQRLYLDLYAKLFAVYQAAATADNQVLKARRLLDLMTLAESLYRGELPELDDAIRKENDLDMVLVLTGL